MLKLKNELRKSQGLGSVLRWPHAFDGMLKPKNELRKSQRLGSTLRWPHAADGMLKPKNELRKSQGVCSGPAALRGPLCFAL